MSVLHAVISLAVMPKPCINLSKRFTNSPMTLFYICVTIILHNIVSLAQKVQLVHKSGIIFTYVKELVRKNLCLCAKNVMRPWQCHDYYCHRYKSISVQDRKSTRLNSSHVANSYAVFCLKKNKNDIRVEHA